jgi:hypothetical protein
VTALLTRRVLFLVGLLVTTTGVYAGSSQQAPADTSARPATPAEANDLDAFMARVLQRRSENWKTLHDYVLNEKEHFDLLGPGRARLFGTNREFTWYLREGVLVRSPVRFDGVAIGVEDRKKYEDKWTREEDEREKARRLRQERRARKEQPREDAGGDLTSLAREGAEPRFISESYFMNFHFEPGNYYLAGRERLEGREVLRIEYYPTHLFRDKKQKEETKTKDQEMEDEITRQFNKVAVVTLWVDPQEHQIVKFTFVNIDFGFLPGRWLVRTDDVTASMVMSQPIAGIWLPREISASGRLTFANGTYELRYGREFYDYQQGEVKTKIRGFTPKEQ